MKRSIAIVSKQRLVGSTNGSSTYLLAIARTLADAGFGVHLIQPSPDIFGRTPAFLSQPEMNVFASHRVRGAIRLGRLHIVISTAVWWSALTGILRRLLRGMGATGAWVKDRPRPYSVATPWRSNDLRFVERCMPAGCVAVIADYIFCSSALAVAPKGASTAIIMHDLFHARAGGAQDSVAAICYDDEVRLLSSAQAVFAIQDTELAFVKTHVPSTRALLVPMPALLAAEPSPGAEDTLLFVGSHTAPNSVGLAWFFDQIWPHVLRRRPLSRLTVAGTVNRAFEDTAIPGVSFLGIVPDLAPLYRAAGVVISPLTFGSGLKIKLVEALAAGKATVVTGITLQGVMDLCKDSVTVADDAQDFALAIIRLSDDPEAREALAQRAHACATEHFSPSAVHQKLKQWAEQAAAQAISRL